MTQKRHLWYMDLGLATLERLVNHVIGYVMANSSYMPDLGSLPHPHGLEHAPVV